jgi:septal ring factor EnvC (AmiA/AmiB activator)
MLDVFLGFSPYILPYSNFVVDVITRETDIVTPNFFDLISNNVTIFSSFLSSLTVILTSVIGVGLWLRKQMLSENKKLEERTTLALDQAKSDTKQAVTENRFQIQEVNSSLKAQIQSSDRNITDRLKDQKEGIDDIKSVIEKIDDKLDKNSDNVSRNSVKIEAHDMRIRSIEELIYGKYIYQQGHIQPNANLSSSHNRENLDNTT